MSALDYTNRYNTPLTPAETYDYQNWIKLMSALNGRDMSGDTFNYDMQGAFKGGAGQAGNMHFPDTWKKPNHPSFSDQSVYNGADGQQGGSWQQTNGQWSFVPGSTNLQMHGVQGLQDYFQQADPDVQLQLPAQLPAPDMLSFVRSKTGL